MGIGQFGHYVAGDRLPLAQRFDLVFEGAKLLPLRGFDKTLEAAENPLQAPVVKTVLDAVRIHHTFAPIVTGLEPPGLGARRILQRLEIGHPPIAELGAHQWLLAVLLGFRWRKQAVVAAGQPFDEPVPAVPMVRKSRIKMVIGYVGLNVKARRQRRIVDDQPARIIRFEPPEGLF